MKNLLPLHVLTAALWCGAPAPAAERPNIVFIMADDLGYGDVGCNGQREIQTPHIDRMAIEGVRFTDYYAGSTVCAPSRCVLMTGLHLGHCYIRGNGKENLRPDDITVAEKMREAGYATGMFGKWGLGHENSTGLPTLQGFDEFFGYLDQHHAHNYYPAFLIRDSERVPLTNVVPGFGEWGEGVATHKSEYSSDLISEAALDFVRRHHDRPFFLYFPTTLPHANNEAKDRGMEVPDLGIYHHKNWPLVQKEHAAMISRLDGDIGRLMTLLKELGIDDKTIVFFTSDNGPHREGGNNPDFNDSNGPLRGTKRDLYEGGIRVPMIVRWPGKTKPGTTSTHQGYHGDLMATACDVAGIEPPSDLDSISMLPAILGASGQKTHEYLYWEFYERGWDEAVRQGNWKLVRKGGPTAKSELYDLSQDIGEQNNVAAKHPDIVKKLETIITLAHVDNPRWQPKTSSR